MEVTIELLSSLNPNCDYYPAGFDDTAWKQYLEDVAHFRTGLSFEFGIEFRSITMEDATHGAEITFPSSLIEGVGDVFPCIRISKHGRYFVITVVRRLSSATEQKVILAARRAGFIYTPESLFGLPFDQRERINGDLFNQLYDYV